MRRRTFVGRVGAFAFAPFAGAFADERSRIARIGVMTDTHIGETEASCSRVRLALELFRAKGVDMIANCGDIADYHYPSGYRAYRKVFNDVFPDAGRRPKELYVFAGHDAFNYKGCGRDIMPHLQDAYADVQKLLETSNGPYGEGLINGLPYLVFPQFMDYGRFRETVARTVKANPGKPVLVFEHVPPAGTAYNSWDWGDGEIRKILNDFPQIVEFSGHIHGSLRGENYIWQKEFTVLNAGCLQQWGGLLACSKTTGKESYGVLVVDFFNDRLVAHRHDVRDGSEIFPDEPWTVALPFAASTAQYRLECRKARSTAPQFAAGAKLAVTADDRNFTGFKLTFPEAMAGDRRTFIYRIEAMRHADGGGWETFAIKEMYGDFYLRPQDRTGSAHEEVPASLFRPGMDCRIRVTPQNEFGLKGRPLVADVLVPTTFDPGTIVFRSDTPMKEMVFENDAGRTVRADVDGEFYSPRRKEGRFNRLVLPKGLFAGDPGTRYRVTLEAHLKQQEDGPSWSLNLVPPKIRRPASPRVGTPGGDSGRLTYVIDYVKKAKGFSSGDTYRINFLWGGVGTVKLHSVIVSRIG